MAKLQADLREFIELLNSHDVEYVVVGGHAVAFHGHPRYTGDIDFLIRATPTNVRRVLAALNAFGFGSLGITEGDLLDPGRIVQLGHPPNRIDILTSLQGVTFEEAWSGRAAGTYGSQEVFYLGKSELIRNKRSVARPQDQMDLRWLL